MDSERAESADKVGLPKSKDFKPKPVEASSAPSWANDVPAGPPATIAAAENDKGGVFQRLVKDDADIAGLVAYSIYKQNKLDWLRAFQKAKGRAPNEDELGSYILGEGTARRLATYRHLAEATLAGHGPEIGDGPVTAAPFRRLDRSALTTSVLASYAIIAIIAAIVLWVALHFTMSTR